jgi:hypothetical protein
MAKGQKRSGEREKGAKAPKPRRERVFEPLPSGNRVVVVVMGIAGAVAMGAGVYGQFVGLGSPAVRFEQAPWILAGGALLVALAIWFGWSGDPVLHVGDAGIGVERGALRRMPWYAVERVRFAGGAVRVTGKDEADQPLTVVASVKSQPQAAAWIVRETRARLASLLEMDEGAEVPAAVKSAGEIVELEPPQVVGKKCVASGKMIAYEPDARVCSNCGRVYHRAHVPDVCACDASMKAKPKEKPKEKKEAAEAEDPIGAELTKGDDAPAPQEKPG